MGLVPMRVLLRAAEKGGYAVGAYNVNNMEQAQGIMAAAVQTESPLIYQVSRGALQYSNKEILRDIILSIVNMNPQVPVALHLDHGNSPESCIEAIKLGFTSVMMDGSLQENGKTPSDYGYNRDVTRAVVKYAHERGVTVEGEIGCLGGLEDGHGSGEERITLPGDLQRLFADCGMDACAIAWGTSHGAYKGVKGQPPKLRHDVVRACHEQAPGVYLVSHGSSSVPAELVEKVNSFGVIRKYVGADGHKHLSAYGEDFDLEIADPKKVLDFLVESQRMPESVGVPMEDLQQAIQEGMRKINVDTDGRLAVTGTILDVFEANPSEFDPRKYLGPARDAIASFAKVGMIGFGSAGHATDIDQSITLKEMARQYRQ
ncbi:MAG: ketose-bisphosphate aldolase [Nanoarchaeota archaeon]|nr:ketose-bisphosphate aldolase [Nanoarchaeota archaeon]